MNRSISKVISEKLQQLEKNFYVSYEERVLVKAPKDLVAKNTDQVLKYLDAIKCIENTIKGRNGMIPDDFSNPHTEWTNIIYLDSNGNIKNFPHIEISISHEEYIFTASNISITVIISNTI